jgi:hypothetical protein
MSQKKCKRNGLGYNYGIRGLDPKPEDPAKEHRMRSGWCPKCLEDRAKNIIELGRGARECRLCGNYYFLNEKLSRRFL